MEIEYSYSVGSDVFIAEQNTIIAGKINSFNYRKNVNGTILKYLIFTERGMFLRTENQIFDNMPDIITFLTA